MLMRISTSEMSGKSTNVSAMIMSDFELPSRTYPIRLNSQLLTKETIRRSHDRCTQSANIRVFIRRFNDPVSTDDLEYFSQRFLLSYMLQRNVAIFFLLTNVKYIMFMYD